MKKKNLTSKEKLFCYMYAICGNVREAAMKSGYLKGPDRAGARLISRRDIVREISRIKETIADVGAISGLNRLAYGSVNDAVKLLREETLASSDIDSLDLYSISEIKKPKEGCLEIKFFDRLKALEKLYLINEARSADEFESFYRALEKSAEAGKESVDEPA